MKPVLVLIGGATGTGKSTVAARVGRALGITQVTSTDAVRRTMRASVASELMPSLHVSSFEGDPLIPTFVEQTEAVLPGVCAAFDRALQDGRSTVVEGVHLVPGLLDVPGEDAVVVQCTLSIPTADAHAEHLARRGERYVARLDDIRRVHDFVVEASLAQGVTVIDNEDADATVERILELVPEPERV